MGDSKFRRRRAVLIIALPLVIGGCSAGSGSDRPSQSPSPTPTITSGSAPLLTRADRTILGQPLAYPTVGPAKVSSSVVTLTAGDETGWHRNDTPAYIYVLSGTITVSYETGPVKEYGAGTGYLEAVGTQHNGQNRGDAPVKLLIVNLGAEGIADTVPRQKP